MVLKNHQVVAQGLSTNIHKKDVLTFLITMLSGT